jgi:hypothetical protein
LRVVGVAYLLIIILPLLFAIVLGVSSSRAMGLVGSTFTLEYLAIPLGVGLNLLPGYVFLTVVSASIGIFTLVLRVFGLLGAQSRRVVDFLLKLRRRAQRLRTYGICGSIPGATVLGIYGSAARVWAFGWDVGRSTLLTTAGLILISAILLLSSIDVFGAI